MGGQCTNKECCWRLWGSVRCQDGCGGDVPGLRRFWRSYGALGACERRRAGYKHMGGYYKGLWEAMGDIRTWAGYDTSCMSRIMFRKRKDVG